MKNLLLLFFLFTILVCCKKKEAPIEEPVVIDNSPKDSCSKYGICMTGLFEFYNPAHNWNDTTMQFQRIRVKFDGFIPYAIIPSDSLQYSFHANTFSQNLIDTNFKNHFSLHERGMSTNGYHTVAIIQFKSGKRAAFYKIRD